jgi:hypothetical protein
MISKYTYIQNYVNHDPADGSEFIEYFITVATPDGLAVDVYDYQYGPIFSRSRALRLADKIAIDQSAPVENLCAITPENLSQ